MKKIKNNSVLKEKRSTINIIQKQEGFKAYEFIKNVIFMFSKDTYIFHLTIA